MIKSNYTPTKRTQRDYSLGFKLQVVVTVEKGDMTYEQAKKNYTVNERSWIVPMSVVNQWNDISRANKEFFSNPFHSDYQFLANTSVQ